MKKINTKIPGIIPPPPKNEIDGKIENLSAKSIPDLLDLRDRQLKLLGNKFFIAKLKDKGEKIQSFLTKINDELKVKQEEEEACKLFSKFNLNPIDKNTLENVEWEGKLQKNENTYLDSDDDSEPDDVIHILSQNTSQGKKIKVIQPEKPLITAKDIIDIDGMPHVKYIVEKTENKAKPKSTGNFKPFKTTRSDVHNPEKEIHRKRNKHWEVTAATPPPIVHGPAKVLTIQESLILQNEYNIHLKEVEAKHAAEKLLARTGIKMAELPSDVDAFGKHREVDSDDSASESDPEGSDKEVHDEEPERGGVVFTVMN